MTCRIMINFARIDTAANLPPLLVHHNSCDGDVVGHAGGEGKHEVNP